MKKFFCTLFIVCTGVLSLRLAEAAPSYGTNMPKARKVQVGLQNYSLLRRTLETDYGVMRSDQQFFLLTLGITDWFCLDGKIGTGDIRMYPGQSEKLTYDPAFAGGYGFRLRVYESSNEKLSCVFAFHHISVHPYSVKSNSIRHRSILDDWQVSFVGSYRVGAIMPYTGLKWSRVDYIHWIEEDRKRTMSDMTRDVGAIVGIDIPLKKDTIILNLEGHFIDETAVSCGVLYQF